MTNSELGMDLLDKFLSLKQRKAMKQIYLSSQEPEAKRLQLRFLFVLYRFDGRLGFLLFETTASLNHHPNSTIQQWHQQCGGSHSPTKHNVFQL
jgi:hypothetical protein